MQHRRGGGGRDRRPYGDRPERSGREDRGGFGGPPRDDRGFGGPPRDDRRGYARRDDRGFGAPPRRDRFPARGDDGGMSLRLDPRRLGTLKQMAAEQGMRPGELVTRWIEERIDAERGGGRAAAPSAPPDVISEIKSRLDALSRRVDALAGSGFATAESPPAPEPEATEPTYQAEPVEVVSSAKSGETPEAQTAPARRARRSRSEQNGRGPKVALHDEIIAVITERGPMSAADLASAITERGRYTAPRSGKPLDAATVSARVSNPVYRSRFRRENGRIALAE